MIKSLIKNAFLKQGYEIVPKDTSVNANFYNQHTIKSKYQELIDSTITLYEDLIFQQDLSLNQTQKELLAKLLGTSIGEGLYIIRHLKEIIHIEGDICEFGIAQGATSTLIAHEIQNTTKTLWLFDSFQGLPKPTPKDNLKDDIFNLGSLEAYEGKMAYGLQFVEERLTAINFPKDRVNVVPGFIEQTILLPNIPNKVSFAYIDFDFYEPILITLNFLEKVIQSQGVIIVDDYDHFSTGVKTAVEEFLDKNSKDYQFILPYKHAGNFCILIKN